MTRAGTKTHSLAVFESSRELRLRTWLQLARAFSVIERLISTELADQGVTLPQFDVLATLRFSEGVTQKDLAERLLVTKGNVCGLLDRLENLGWVQRRTDEKDSRINRLHLTAAGRRKIETVLPRHDELVLSTLSNLPDNEVRSLRSSLERLEGNSHDR